MNLVSDPTAVAGELRPVLLKIGRRLRREVSDLGLTGSQVSLLYQVSQRAGIGICDLAALEGVSTPRMSTAVALLAEKGLVERTRDGEDRRRVSVSITPAGSSLLQKVRRRRTAWLADRLRRLDDDELAAIEAAAPALAKLLEGGE